MREREERERGERESRYKRCLLKDLLWMTTEMRVTADGHYQALKELWRGTGEEKPFVH